MFLISCVGTLDTHTNLTYKNTSFKPNPVKLNSECESSLWRWKFQFQKASRRMTILNLKTKKAIELSKPQIVTENELSLSSSSNNDGTESKPPKFESEEVFKKVSKFSEEQNYHAGG